MAEDKLIKNKLISKGLLTIILLDKVITPDIGFRAIRYFAHSNFIIETGYITGVRNIKD